MDLTDLFAEWDNRTTSKIFYEKANKRGQCGEALTTTEFDAEKKLIEETGEIPTREKIHAKIREIMLDWTPPANRSDSSCIHEPWEEFVSNEIFMNTGQKPTVGEVHKFVHEKRHYPLINELHVSPAHEEILNILQENKAISETPEFGSVRYTSLYPPPFIGTLKDAVTFVHCITFIRTLHTMPIHRGLQMSKLQRLKSWSKCTMLKGMYTV